MSVVQRLKRRLAGLRTPSRAARLWVGGLLGLSLVAMLVTCQLLSDSGPVDASGETPEVKVLLERGVDRFQFTLDGPYEIRDADQAVIAGGASLRPGVFRLDRRGLAVNGHSLERDEVRIRPRGDHDFAMGKLRYPGELLLRRSGQRIEVINVLDMETYVIGVLFSEMPLSFGRPALQAQSVAARSYAYWRLQTGNEVLLPSQADQMYKGRGELTAKAADIVRSTRGQILETDGDIFCTYYSSTCGGGTSSAQDIFHANASSALRGSKCSWCQTAPRYRWNRTISKSELSRRLGLGSKTLRDLQLKKDKAGRALHVRAVGEGWNRTWTGLQFRQKWNASAPSGQDLPSNLLHSIRLGDTIRIDGGGYGHGVGMCQYGCRGLAQEGRDYREILAVYYPGAEVRARW